MGRFLFSFFKELNSATNKHMIALALVLGLISGFLPTFTMLNYIIFLVVLIFRIPIGLYTASFAVFSLISYLFDPIFNKIGYVVLTSDILKPFWTFLYNLPILRWSGFNNTLVMGALISGIIVGIVLYFVLVKSIEKYRKTIFPKIKNIKILSWIVPEEEKKGIIRISGVVASVAVIGFTSFVMVVFLDPFIKALMTYTLSKTFHKKVYIQEVKTKIFEPSFMIENMQIDNFLIQKAYVKLNMKNLLWKKFDIENLSFKAKTNESIIDLLKRSSQKNSKTAFKLPKIKLPNPKEIVNSPNLKSIEAIKKLEKDYKKFEKYYKSLNIKDYKAQIEKIKKEILSLKKLKIKTPQDIVSAKKKFDLIETQIKSLNSEVNNQLKTLKGYKKLLESDIQNVKVALKADYKNIKNQYSLLKEGNFIKLSEIYFKPEIEKYIKFADVVYKKIKPFINHSSKEVTVIPRKGIYIKFEDKIKYPDFVIREGKGLITTSIAKYTLDLKNISDNQHLLGKRAVVDIVGDSKFYYAKLKTTYYDFIAFKGQVKNVRIKKITLNDLEILHSLISADFKGKYNNKLYLNADIFFNKSEVVLNREDNISKIINKVLKSVHNFRLSVKAVGDKVEISSDLDKIIAKAIENVYKKELNRQKQRAIKLLNERVNNELKKYNLNVVDNDIKSMSDIKNYLNKLLKEAKKQLIKKEKNRIKNEIQDKILKNIKLF